MLEAGSIIVVADTSVLVNFLRIDRMDLIANISHEILATDHVAEEISAGYADQIARYENAINGNMLNQITLDLEVELETFAGLSASGRIGVGECSAIAYAVCRKHALAIDDRRAVTQVKVVDASLPIVGTSDLVVSMIKEKLLTVEEADLIKNDWSRYHRYTLNYDNFAKFVKVDCY